MYTESTVILLEFSWVLILNILFNKTQVQSTWKHFQNMYLDTMSTSTIYHSFVSSHQYFIYFSYVCVCVCVWYFIDLFVTYGFIDYFMHTWIYYFEFWNKNLFLTQKRWSNLDSLKNFIRLFWLNQILHHELEGGCAVSRRYSHLSDASWVFLLPIMHSLHRDLNILG